LGGEGGEVEEAPCRIPKLKRENLAVKKKKERAKSSRTTLHQLPFGKIRMEQLWRGGAGGGGKREKGSPSDPRIEEKGRQYSFGEKAFLLEKGGRSAAVSEKIITTFSRLVQEEENH